MKSYKNIYGARVALATVIGLGISARLLASTAEVQELPDQRRFIQVPAATKEDRSALANQGMTIEFVKSDSVWGFATPKEIEAIEKTGRKIQSNLDISVARGGHQGIFDFPTRDERFHNYNEVNQALQELQTNNPELVRISSIGRSVQGREIYAIHINSNAADLESGMSTKPGIVYMGTHHAREHVSTEIPLMFAQYLLTHKTDANIAPLLDTRDIWIIPLVNPDGVEYDIATGNYRTWRKNRRNNNDGTYGVDLNRNYGFMWNTGGSSDDTDSEVYHGPNAFSEPETIAIRDFIDARSNFKVLLSFHTFSELILYPWGHTNDPISNQRDISVFTTMAQTMAQWNRYTPEQSSELYIASGDTTDWAYGVHGIFAFTFELSPRSIFGGGFYPGQGVIDRVFSDNLRPCLYLLEHTMNPYDVLPGGGMLKNFVQPSAQNSSLTSLNPLLN